MGGFGGGVGLEDYRMQQVRSDGSLPADSATEAVVGGGGVCGFALGPRACRLGCQGGRASLLVSSVAVTICVSVSC